MSVDDFRLPDDMTLQGFGHQIAELLDEADFLTNRLLSDFAERYRRLEQRELKLIDEVKPLRAKLRAGVLSSDGGVHLLAASHDLLRVRLDMVDTENAITMLELDKTTFPPMKYREGNLVAEVDNRELHR